ncbi:MAG: cupin domain-containing protein, partial [Pseudomonadota bacterium]
FFQDRADVARRIVFSASEAIDVRLPDMPDGGLIAKLMTPIDYDGQAEPYMIELSPDAKLPCHFFVHKGEEVGYLLSGRLQMTVEKAVYKLKSGDLVYLTSEIPNQWINPGPGVAKLIWLKLK